jgi:hypothetical protein
MEKYFHHVYELINKNTVGVFKKAARIYDNTLNENKKTIY